MIDDRKRTKKEEVAHLEMLQSMHRIKIEMENDQLIRESIPRGWISLEDTYPPRPKKVRVTAGYDEQVVKFYRSYGPGYQAKMNEVLKLFMLARISKRIEASNDRDEFGKLI